MTGLDIIVIMSLALNIYLFVVKTEYKYKSQFWKEEWERAMGRWSQEIERGYKKSLDA
jgi:Ni,Fe-hydrogenase I cytochrome b subunit